MNIAAPANCRGVSEMLGHLLHSTDDSSFALRFAANPLEFTQGLCGELRSSPGPKSFAVISSPVISRKYSFTSADPTVWRSPSSSTYWNSSYPGRSRQSLTMRARRRSLMSVSWCLPLLPRKLMWIRLPSMATCRSRRVVSPKLLFALAYSLLPIRKNVSSIRRTMAARTLSRCKPGRLRSSSTRARSCGSTWVKIRSLLYFASSRTPRQRGW
jgi:hypothetical protein